MESNTMGRQKAYSLNIEICEASTFTIKGDCLDSPCSPLRLKNGQRVCVCEVVGFNPYGDIEKVQGKVCCIQYIHNGYTYFVAKEVVGIDEVTDRLRLRFYNPEQKDLYIEIGKIQSVWVVNGLKE